jgi:hypothetical protein
MGSHPVNLGLRFMLEMAALVAIGRWGWGRASGPLRYLLAIGLPVAAAAVWGAFRTSDDPSASGRAPVPVPGAVRLTIELAILGCAVWCLVDASAVTVGVVFGVVVLLHYAASYDRITWLLRQ